MKFGPNSIWLGAAAVLLVAGAAAQNGRDQRMQRQEQRQERQQAQREQRGFQPPPRNSGGFGQQPASNQPQQQNQAQRGLGGARMFGPGPHAGDWLRRNRNLPLNQQLQQLQSDPAFRRLAPQQQDQMRERLQHFNSLTPEQQDRMLDRMEMREHLPPEQRQEENELARRYRGLPAGRQQAVKNAVSELSALPPQERQQQLSSPLFRSRFTDNEREIIGQALEMRPTQGRPQAGEPPELP
ncbi:MAG TPA: DUF3106 domain-containing protein [Terriglobales bacterium]|nr:DUF3106 domain-containing protein [Terriglobales bacterium]